MSRIQIPMPQMGESIAEGTVSLWLKKVGDPIERDEPIMEISTDKVDAEIPSPTAGVLAEIVVPEGQTVEVGTVVAYVETDPAAVLEAAGEAAGAATGAEAPEEAVAGRGAGASRPAETAAAVGAPPLGSGMTSPVPAVPVRQFGGGEGRAGAALPLPEHPGGNGRAETEEERLRRRSTPLVRRIAEEHGVRLEAVQGSGRAGRVTKEDILRYVEDGGTGAAPVAGTGPPAAPVPTPASPLDAISWADYYSRVEHPEVEVGEGDRVEPMSRMTSLIAEHMVLSKRIAAHVHSYTEVDYSRVDQIRERQHEMWVEQGVKVTYTAFIAKAIVQALRDHPRLNASISGRNVVYRGEINLGIAVALDWGLIVPVIRNADNLSVMGLARAIADLAARARAKKLSPEDVKGGTFTITNPGIFGTVLGFPIVHQPQVAILGVGAVEKRVVVVPDDAGNDAIVVRQRGYLSLGFDHRLVNGADADRFLGRVKELLETMSE